MIDELTNPARNLGSPKKIINISFKESSSMCANMFDVLDKNGNHCVVMSKRARNAFTEKNSTELNQNYKLVVSDVDIIEAIGGGSCRCMLVELF